MHMNGLPGQRGRAGAGVLEGSGLEMLLFSSAPSLRDSYAEVTMATFAPTRFLV